MSNYFRVLKRLESEKTEREAPAQELDVRASGARQRAAARVSAASTVTPLVAPTAAPAAQATAASPAAASPPTEERHAGDTAPRTAATPRGIATLFDNIRALASDRPTRMLVFAGASAAESVGAVAAGLASHAERHGVRVLLADLRQVGGRAKLLPRAGGRSRAAHLVGNTDESLTVDLARSAAPADLERWVERSAPGTDLLIVTGPPLAESIDAALLASACDGLVIVAELEVTERSALQAAAERARVAGCRTLGVVMHGTQDRTPTWMHRLMGSTHTAPTQRKD